MWLEVIAWKNTDTRHMRGKSHLNTNHSLHMLLALFHERFFMNICIHACLPLRV